MRWQFRPGEFLTGWVLEMGWERVWGVCDDVFFDDASADEMFLDDGFEDIGVAVAIPDAFGIDDADRAVFADVDALHFGA